MRRSTGGWAAACEGTVLEHAVLAEAIRGVIGDDEGVSTLGAGDAEALDRWAQDTARHILGDAETDLP